MLTIISFIGNNLLGIYIVHQNVLSSQAYLREQWSLMRSLRSNTSDGIVNHHSSVADRNNTEIIWPLHLWLATSVLWLIICQLSDSVTESLPPSPAPLRPPGSHLPWAVAAFPAACPAFEQAWRSSEGRACARRTSGESRPRSSSARSRTCKSAEGTTEVKPEAKKQRLGLNQSLIRRKSVTRAGMSFSSNREMKARLSAPSLAERS